MNCSGIDIFNPYSWVVFSGFLTGIAVTGLFKGKQLNWALFSFLLSGSLLMALPYIVVSVFYDRHRFTLPYDGNWAAISGICAVGFVHYVVFTAMASWGVVWPLRPILVALKLVNPGPPEVEARGLRSEDEDTTPGQPPHDRPDGPGPRRAPGDCRR